MITKEFLPSAERRLAVNLNVSPTVKTIMIGHGNIPSYTDKYYRKSTVPMQTRHTNSRSFGLPVQKAKE